MSEMAAQMAARIAEDGGAGLAHSDSGVVPGNEGGQTPQTTPPAAEPSTTDTGVAGGPPDTIPYTRFKEVNDRYTALKGYEQLAEYGYDPDSLGRLAAFEAQYLHDPVGTWRQIGDNLDLPQPLKDAIAQHLDASGAAEAQQAEGQSNGQPTGAQPTSPEMQRVLAFIEKQEKADAEAAVKAAEAQSDQRLGMAVSHWDALDNRDQIETPEAIKLMAISATAGSGQRFHSVEALTEAARATIVGYRSSVLGGAIQRTGHSAGAPPALPGSAPGASGPMRFGTDIKAATRAAQAAIESGQLPG